MTAASPGRPRSRPRARRNDPHEREGRWVPDPFAFPSETRGRFVLLMLAVVLIATGLGYGRTTDGLRTFVQDMYPRQAESAAELAEERAGPGAHLDLGVTLERLEATSTLVRGMLPRALLIAAVPLGTLLSTLLLAALHYLSHPWRLRRRHGSRPLAPDEAPALRSLLRGKLAEHGVHREPVLHAKPGGFASDGMAYGLEGREVIYLPQDPVFLEGAEQGATASIALHELAHLVNRDTQAVERSRALVFGLLVVGLCLPLAWPGESPRHLALEALGLLALVAVLWLLWIGLVRSRELYADWRVVLWGHGDGLVRRLRGEAAKVTPGSGPARRALHGLRRGGRFLRPHPPDAERLATLADPVRLFRISGSLAFVTGFLLAWVLLAGLAVALSGLPVSMVLLEHLYDALLTLADRQPDDRREMARWGASVVSRTLVPVLMALLFFLGVAHLVTRTLGVQAQRSAIQQLDRRQVSGWGYLPLWRPALCLALGLEGGILTLPWTTAVAFRSWSLPLNAPWFLGFFLVSGLWLAYNHAAARLVLATRGTRERAVRTQKRITRSATLLLAAVFVPAFYGRLALLILSVVDPEGGLDGAFGGAPQRYLGDPQAYFVVTFVSVSLILLFLMAVAFLVWGGGLLAVSFPFRRSGRCSTCGEGVPHSRRVGALCTGCHQPLAPWLYARPGKAPP